MVKLCCFCLGAILVHVVGLLRGVFLCEGPVGAGCIGCVTVAATYVVGLEVQLCFGWGTET